MHRWHWCALLVGVLAIVFAGSASAATIKVTTKKDEFGSGGTPKCALREAVQAANTNKRFGGCRKGKGTDTIVLGRGVYKLSIPGTGENANADGDLDTTANLKIRGKGRAKTAIDGNGNVVQERILERVQGNLNVANLTLRNADAVSAGDHGGAVAAMESTAENGTLALRGVSVEDNYVSSSGGGVGADYGNVRIVGSRIVDNDAGEYGGGVYFDSDGKLTIKNAVIAGNQADDGSGGIDVESSTAKTLIDRTVIRDNGSYDYGGGVFLEGETAKITRSTISGNYNHSYEGGGLYVYRVTEPAIVDRTTISNNHSYGVGAGVYVYDSPVVIRNSTISRNYTYDDGGGIYAWADVTLRNSTVARNFAVDDGGGIYNNGVAVRYRNSIIARNHAYGDSGDFEDCAGTDATSLGRNLLGDATCAGDASDLKGEASAPLDPKLGPLGNYGGPTQTLPLLTRSPAIDKGQGCPKRDQRGHKRKGKCDIGAFER